MPDDVPKAKIIHKLIINKMEGITDSKEEPFAADGTGEDAKDAKENKMKRR